VREDPAKAVGLALFTGVLLTVLPWPAALRGGAPGVRPVASAAAGAGRGQLYEEYQKNRQP